MTATQTNPKPPTLPVLTEEHAAMLHLAITNDFNERPLLYEVQAVVRSLILGGTHELQERVSGDTVRVSRSEAEAVRKTFVALMKNSRDENDEAGFNTLALMVMRWLSGDKP